MEIGKNVTETINDGISAQIVDELFYQKEDSVTREWEEHCDAILYDAVTNIMESFEIDNLINLNPFL
jgi:hypothetical protein